MTRTKSNQIFAQAMKKVKARRKVKKSRQYRR